MTTFSNATKIAMIFMGISAIGNGMPLRENVNIDDTSGNLIGGCIGTIYGCCRDNVTSCTKMNCTNCLNGTNFITM